MEKYQTNEENICDANNLERFDELLEELKDSRMRLLKGIRDYYICRRDAQLEKISRFRNKKRIRRHYVFTCNEYLERISNLNMVFSQFKILGPGIIEYGTKEKGNYSLCILGIKDCFRNALWIHENLIQELIYGMWPTQSNISDEFEHYKSLLAEYKLISYEVCK